MTLARSLAAWAVLLIGLGLGLAQPQLVVNGLEVADATNALVPGTAYAPAAGLAQALGARLDVDAASQRVTLTIGGRIVQLRLVEDAHRAALADAVRVDGVVREGPAAVLVGVEPFVPVKITAEALGGRVSFVPERNQVIVIVPRATITAQHEGSGSTERLVLRASAPTRVNSYFNETVQTLQLRFERAEIAAARSFTGDAFVRADVLPGRGDVDVRIQLAPDVRASWTELPDGRGFAVVVSFARAVAGRPEASEPVAPPAAARVVLDPAGGTGPGAAYAAPLTIEVARIVAQRLERAGYEVELTRPGSALPSVADRAAQGAGARLFLTLQQADLPPGNLRIYHLGDAGDLGALNDAVRINAEALLQRPETDGARRAVLLDLVVDFGLGVRYAEALARELRQAGGYQVDGPRGAPVAVLTGAAGRGVLIEASAADLRDPGFAQLLAAVIATVVATGGFVP